MASEDPTYQQLRLFLEPRVDYSLDDAGDAAHMHSYTKQTLIKALKKIRDRGWIANTRHGNVGGVGNTLEDLLGIKENNLPIPNAAEWELKCQRTGTTSLTTLFHMEPSPRVFRFVPQVFLPKYGWPHEEAGTLYPKGEQSFRQTLHAGAPSDRGFSVVVDRENRKVLISFDASQIDSRHAAWQATVKQRAGLGELNPQPYWGFDDLFHKAGTKLLNCFYVQAEVKRESGQELFWYSKIIMLRGFSLSRWLRSLEKGYILIDFDARTGHNHGTKFRLRQDKLSELYAEVTEID